MELKVILINQVRLADGKAATITSSPEDLKC